MNHIYFGTVTISGEADENQKFYRSGEEASKDLDDQIHEELRNVQKLVHDYGLSTPILDKLFKKLTVRVSVREYTLSEENAS